MIVYPNPIPIVYFSSSVASLYLGFKSGFRACHCLMKPIFGSTPLKERIESVAKETISEEFSVANLVYGKDLFHQRVFSTISGLFYLSSSVTFFFLASTFYYWSIQLQPNDADSLAICEQALNEYEGHFNQTVMVHDYWTKSLCELDEEQWQSSFTERCLNSNFYKYLPFRQDCNDAFIDMSFQAYSKNILLEEWVEGQLRGLFDKAKTTKKVCESHLFEVGHRVNEQCNSMVHPYIGFTPSGSCRVWRTLGASDECLNACNEYEEKHNRVYGVTWKKPPEIEGITLNCTQISKKKIEVIPYNATIKGKEVNVTDSFRQYLKEKLITFNQEDWRNVTKVKTFEEQERDLIEPWIEIDTEKDPSRLKFLKHFFILRRNLLRDLKAKDNFKSSLEQFKPRMDELSLKKIESRKEIIIK